MIIPYMYKQRQSVRLTFNLIIFDESVHLLYIVRSGPGFKTVMKGVCLSVVYE